MTEFTCPSTGNTFETSDVRVVEPGAGRVVLKAVDGCPHCGKAGHSRRASVAELDEIR